MQTIFVLRLKGYGFVLGAMQKDCEKRLEKYTNNELLIKREDYKNHRKQKDKQDQNQNVERKNENETERNERKKKE